MPLCHTGCARALHPMNACRPSPANVTATSTWFGYSALASSRGSGAPSNVPRSARETTDPDASKRTNDTVIRVGEPSIHAAEVAHTQARLPSASCRSWLGQPEPVRPDPSDPVVRSAIAWSPSSSWTTTRAGSGRSPSTRSFGRADAATPGLAAGVPVPAGVEGTPTSSGRWVSHTPRIAATTVRASAAVAARQARPAHPRAPPAPYARRARTRSRQAGSSSRIDGIGPAGRHVSNEPPERGVVDVAVVARVHLRSAIGLGIEGRVHGITSGGSGDRSAMVGRSKLVVWPGSSARPASRRSRRAACVRERIEPTLPLVVPRKAAIAA